MGKVDIHYPHMMEVSVVFTACMISMLRVAEQCRMTEDEATALVFAHTIIANFMGRLSDQAIDEWRKGIIVALEEIREEDKKDGRPGKSASDGHSPNGTHRA